MQSKSISIFFNQTTMKYDVVLLRGRICDVLGSFDSEMQASRYRSSITGNGKNISIYLTDDMILDIKHFIEGKNLSDKIRNAVDFYIENH